MGLTFVDATVTGPNDKSRSVKLLVDSGASYSFLPDEVWRDLELQPQETLEFILADGTTMQLGEFITEFGLQFVKVVLVCLAEFFFDIGKVYDIAVPEVLVCPINPGKCLKQVMLADNAPEVEFFQPRRIKPG